MYTENIRLGPESKGGPLCNSRWINHCTNTKVHLILKLHFTCKLFLAFENICFDKQYIKIDASRPYSSNII